jgi:hypothetical protein
VKWLAVAVLGVALAVAAVVIVGARGATSQPAPAAVAADAGARADAGSPLALAVQRGQALRVAAAEGPIHVWRPAGYHADTAATVVYVHGYYTDVDTAWRDHQLPAQFAASAVNALFVAPEAPDGARQQIQFRDLGELLRTVETELGEPRPSGPLIILAHSGAYRTVLAWLDYPLIDTVVMIDSLYGDFDELRDWLAHGPARRLVTIGDDTLRWTEDFARSIPGTVEVDRIPPEMELWPPEARSARHLYVRSQYGHMTQVTGDVVVPMVLRLEAVELLADAPWDHPLGALPPLPPDAAPAIDAAPVRRARRSP